MTRVRDHIMIQCIPNSAQVINGMSVMSTHHNVDNGDMWRKSSYSLATSLPASYMYIHVFISIVDFNA